MGDGSLPKRCPTKYQRLFMISGDYRIKYWGGHAYKGVFNHLRCSGHTYNWGDNHLVCGAYVYKGVVCHLTCVGYANKGVAYHLTCSGYASKKVVFHLTCVGYANKEVAYLLTCHGYAYNRKHIYFNHFVKGDGRPIERLSTKCKIIPGVDLESKLSFSASKFENFSFA